jgi:uncharacterized membrane protein
VIRAVLTFTLQPLPGDLIKTPMQSETARIEAFSDGVYAIAITLLILEIKVPPATQPLTRGLLAQWPSYFAFLVSFWFIGVMWVNHHRLFTHICKADNGLLFANLLLLLGVTVVPWPTSLLAAHLGKPDQLAAAVVFNGTYFFLAIFFNVLWRYAMHKRLLDPATQTAASAISKQYAVGPLLYLICLGLSWISVPASLAMNVALAVFFALPPKKTVAGG